MSMREKAVQCLITLATIIVLFFLLGTIQYAHALCVTPQEAGSWRNIDANTRSITRAEIRFQCQDQIINGQPYPPGEPFYIRLFGSCHPTDCRWDEAGAKRTNPRDRNSWLKGTLDQGFAKRTIFFKTHPNGRLQVQVYTNFKASNREDYWMNEWFVRQ